jgi:hypothetical protein
LMRNRGGQPHCSQRLWVLRFDCLIAKQTIHEPSPVLLWSLLPTRKR